MSNWISTKKSAPPPLAGMTISDIVLALDEKHMPVLARWHHADQRWILSGYRDERRVAEILYWMRIPLVSESKK